MRNEYLLHELKKQTRETKEEMLLRIGFTAEGITQLKKSFLFEPTIKKIKEKDENINNR